MSYCIKENVMIFIRKIYLNMKNIVFILILSIVVLSNCRVKSKLSADALYHNQAILEVPPHYKLDLSEPTTDQDTLAKSEIESKSKHKFFWSNKKK